MSTKGSRPYDMSIRAQRSAATADRIRDAAWVRFSTRSYDEVTLAEVAEAAGVSVPTVRQGGGGAPPAGRGGPLPAVKEMTEGGRSYHRWWLAEVFEQHLSQLTSATRERRLAQLFLATELEQLLER